MVWVGDHVDLVVAGPGEANRLPEIVHPDSSLSYCLLVLAVHRHQSRSLTVA